MAAAALPRIELDKLSQLPEFSGVFKGRELTRKDRRLSSKIPSIDALLGGGIPRGRISEIVGRHSSGRTSLAAAFMASASRAGEVVAIVDAAHSFDPQSTEQAGVDLKRTLWVCTANLKNSLRAVELILQAGGFGAMVVDFGHQVRSLRESSALRLARWAERSGSSVLISANYRMCGTFSALSINLNCNSPSFNRSGAGGPTLFDGIAVEATLTRNKLGASGGRARWRAVFDSDDRVETSIPSLQKSPLPDQGTVAKFRRGQIASRRSFASLRMT